MKPDDGGSALDRARLVLEAEARAIDGLIGRLDGSFSRAVDIVVACRGRIVTSGIGKSGIICQKIAATFSSTGTPAFFLHPAEAIHGDLGMLVAGDVLILNSYSGETEEVLRLLPLIKRLGLQFIAITGKPGSTLAREADLVLDVSIEEEACPLGLAPTASTTASLAMGDALAMAVSEQRNFSVEQFAERHPGGSLGKRFLRVRDLMHEGVRLPVVARTAPLATALVEMTSKGLGATAVVDADGRLAGLITDGDLRRLLERRNDDALRATAGDAMSRDPRTVDADEFATAALELMERHHITSLLILDDDRRPAGMIHIHDLWRTELF